MRKVSGSGPLVVNADFWIRHIQPTNSDIQYHCLEWHLPLDWSGLWSQHKSEVTKWQILLKSIVKNQPWVQNGHKYHLEYLIFVQVIVRKGWHLDPIVYITTMGLMVLAHLCHKSSIPYKLQSLFQALHEIFLGSLRIGRITVQKTASLTISFYHVKQMNEEFLFDRVC